MSKPQDRDVTRRADGKWQNKRNDSERPTSVHHTQREAEDAARRNLRNQGGGELNTHGRYGKIRSKDTIPPGNDPNPPRDTEHYYSAIDLVYTDSVIIGIAIATGNGYRTAFQAGLPTDETRFR